MDLLLRLWRKTRQAILGRNKDVCGTNKFCTWINVLWTIWSSGMASRTLGMCQPAKRSGSEVASSFPSHSKSALVASSQAGSTILGYFFWQDCATPGGRPFRPGSALAFPTSEQMTSQSIRSLWANILFTSVFRSRFTIYTQRLVHSLENEPISMRIKS